MNIILDGTGKGFKAKVGPENRLFTVSDTRSQSLASSLNGLTFSFAGGQTTLTTAGTSALLYVKNNDERDLIVESIRFQAFNSTGGAGGIPTWGILKNPTSGTIISGGAIAEPSNARFASTNLASVTMIRGGEGFTFTDGAVHANIFGVAVPQLITLDNSEFVIPRGSSIGIRVTPPAGNTSWIVSSGFRGYFLNNP